MPDINWSTLSGSSTISNDFCEFIFQSNLEQLINHPTHKHGNILDLLLTDSTDKIFNLTVHPMEYQCILSDHHLITFTISCKNSTPKPVIKETFNYCKGDYVGLNEYLLNCDVSAIYDLTDPEEIWNVLKCHILTGMNHFIPKVKSRVRQFPVWFTPHLRHLVKCLRTLQRKYGKQPTTINFQKIVKAQSTFQDASRKAKSNYEENLIHNFATNQDPRIYKYIKHFTKSHTLPPQLHLNHNIANTNYHKAELFNQYFFSVFYQLLFSRAEY